MTASQPGPVAPERYAQALGDRDPVESMRQAPARLRHLVRGLGEPALASHPEPGKWSVRQVIAHLADGEVVLGARIRFIAAHDRPPIPAYDQDLFVARLGVERATAARLLDGFEHARAATVELLERLPAGAWERVGIHAERGEESIATLVRLYAGHDRVHEEQVERLRGKLLAHGPG